MNTSNCKHTSGPWFINDNTASAYGQLTVDSAYDGAVAICFTMERDDVAVPAECLANAALIAAAPDLLTALQMVTNCLAWHEKEHGVGMDAAALQNARNAIFKAIG